MAGQAVCLPAWRRLKEAGKLGIWEYQVRYFLCSATGRLLLFFRREALDNAAVLLLVMAHRPPSQNRRQSPRSCAERPPNAAPNCGADCIPAGTSMHEQLPCEVVSLPNACSTPQHRVYHSAHPRLPVRTAGWTKWGQPRTAAVAAAVAGPTPALDAVSTASMGSLSTRPPHMMTTTCVTSRMAIKHDIQPKSVSASKLPAAAPIVQKRGSSPARCPGCCSLHNARVLRNN